MSKNFLYGIAALYQVSLTIRPKSKEFGGKYHPHTKEIIVFYSGDLASDVSVLLHEIGHAHCDREGIWSRYHQPECPEDVLRYAYRAERWVDEWAEAEFKHLFPGGLNGKGYAASYRTPESKVVLRNYLLQSMERMACKPT